jgi:hypothetical protein
LSQTVRRASSSSREDLGVLRVAQRAAEADHRVGLLGLEAVAALQAAELVRAEVDRPVRDRPRSEGAGELLQRRRHARGELSPAALFDEQAGVAAFQRLEHHEFGPEQPDAVDVHGRRARDL